MKSYRIGVIPGDGIGPEVIAEALKVLRAVSQAKGFRYETVHYPWSCQHYLRTGELMPERTLDEYRLLDAILLGAIGDPRVEPGLLERAVVFALRSALDLYVNLRPVKLHAAHLCPLKDKNPEDIDLVVVRENTEGVYVGAGGFHKRGSVSEVSVAEMIYTRQGTERVIRYAFELARARQKARRLTLVDKANMIPAHDLWTRTFQEVGEEYPDIERDHAYVDACCMWLLKKPEWFDVIVTTNLFGDIISELGAMLQGGMGIAGSGNIHPGRTSMFEPIHGSAPKYAGQNVANPLAAISAAAMLLEHIGQKEAGQLIEHAIIDLLQSRRIPSLQAGQGLSTTEIGDLVVGKIEQLVG